MSFVSPLAAIGALISALLGIATTHLFSRGLRLRVDPIPIGDNRQVRFVVLLLIAEFSAIAVFRYFNGTGKAVLGASLDASDVLVELVRSGVVIFLPLVIIAWSTRQSVASLGVRKEDAWKMIALGIAPGAFWFALLVLIAPLVGGGFATLTPSSVGYGLTVFLLVGLSEEIVWRGYVQTRLIARTTKMQGLFAASLLFSLWHIPVNYLIYGGVLEGLSVSLLVQFPLGLGFGYMMIRCQNILPSSIYHMVYDWAPSFFLLPGV